MTPARPCGPCTCCPVNDKPGGSSASTAAPGAASPELALGQVNKRLLPGSGVSFAAHHHGGPATSDKGSPLRVALGRPGRRKGRSAGRRRQQPVFALWPKVVDPTRLSRGKGQCGASQSAWLPAPSGTCHHPGDPAQAPLPHSRVGEQELHGEAGPASGAGRAAGPSPQPLAVTRAQPRHPPLVVARCWP